MQPVQDLRREGRGQGHRVGMPDNHVVLLCHIAAVPHCCCITLLLCHTVAVPHCCCITLLLCHKVAVPHCCGITLLRMLREGAGIGEAGAGGAGA